MHVNFHIHGNEEWRTEISLMERTGAIALTIEKNGEEITIFMDKEQFMQLKNDINIYSLNMLS